MNVGFIINGEPLLWTSTANQVGTQKWLVPCRTVESTWYSVSCFIFCKIRSDLKCIIATISVLELLISHFPRFDRFQFFFVDDNIFYPTALSQRRKLTSRLLLFRYFHDKMLRREPLFSATSTDHYREDYACCVHKVESLSSPTYSFGAKVVPPWKLMSQNYFIVEESPA